MGNSEDKKVNVWKQGNNFTIYAIYSPPNDKPDFTFLYVTSKTILIGDFNAHSSTWGYKDTNTAGKVCTHRSVSEVHIAANPIFVSNAGPNFTITLI
jgi:hypothetical protein